MKRTMLNIYDDDINVVIDEQERALQRSVNQFGREINTAMQQFAEPIDRKLGQVDTAVSQLESVTAAQRKQAERFHQEMLAQATALDVQRADLLAQQQQAKQFQEEVLAQRQQMEALSASLDRQIADADDARKRLEDAKGWIVWIAGAAVTVSLVFVVMPIVLRIIRANVIRHWTPKPRRAVA